MNKIAARKQAQSETFTIGALRDLIAAARRRPDRPSAVNGAISLARACDIYEHALEGRSATEIPKAWRPDVYSRRAGAVKPTRDALIITNILRDCG